MQGNPSPMGVQGFVPADRAAHASSASSASQAGSAGTPATRQAQPAKGGAISCPVCGAPVAPVSKGGTILFYGCTAYRETGCQGMWSADPDNGGKPFVRTCPECGKALVKRRSKKGGRVYVACFNSGAHASGEARFFDADGAPEAPKPKPKGEFACPECGGPLKYFKLKNGRSAGSMCFACFASDRHGDGRPRFFDDQDGAPVFGGGPAQGVRP